MGNSMEKVYDTVKQNDHYSRIYGDPSPLKGGAHSRQKKVFTEA